MQDINNLILVGRLTRDIEIKYSQGGKAIGTTSIAVNRSVKNGEQWVDEASFFDITLFGKTAENLKQYLVKGKQVAIKGSLKQDRWNDKETGKQKSKISIVTEDIELLGGKSDSGTHASNSNEFPEDIPYSQTANGIPDKVPF